MDFTELIDRCALYYGEMDIANLIIMIYKDNIPKGKDLYIKLNDEVPRYFMNRSSYWNQQSILHPDDEKSCQTKSKACLEIAMKFKQSKFKKKIMTEIEYLIK